MREDLSDYTLAVKLKELGFNEPCFAYHSLEPDGKPLVVLSALGDIHNSYLKGRDATAPTLSLVQKWLREEKGIALNVIAHDGGLYQWEAVYLPNAEDSDCDITPDIKQYNTYEFALTAGINNTLDYLCQL